MKLPDNFQMSEHSWPCRFHINYCKNKIQFSQLLIDLSGCVIGYLPQTQVWCRLSPLDIGLVQVISLRHRLGVGYLPQTQVWCGLSPLDIGLLQAYLHQTLTALAGFCCRCITLRHLHPQLCLVQPQMGLAVGFSWENIQERIRLTSCLSNPFNLDIN